MALLRARFTCLEPGSRPGVRNAHGVQESGEAGVRDGESEREEGLHPNHGVPRAGRQVLELEKVDDDGGGEEAEVDCMERPAVGGT